MIPAPTEADLRRDAATEHGTLVDCNVCSGAGYMNDDPDEPCASCGCTGKMEPHGRNGWIRLAVSYKAALAAAQQREAGLRAALKPFADWGRAYEEWCQTVKLDDFVDEETIDGDWNLKTQWPTAGDCRRAAAALAASEPPQGEPAKSQAMKDLDNWLESNRVMECITCHQPVMNPKYASSDCCKSAWMPLIAKEIIGANRPA